MMNQSDNVATNALVRLVRGADHVNEVARSLGAENTLLYQKLSSERAAVPSLDNRTTARDMATMLREIAEGEAASEKSCGDRKSTRLNSSHANISYAVFCLKKNNKQELQILLVETARVFSGFCVVEVQLLHAHLF